MPKRPELPEGYEFHHLGYATMDLGRDRQLLEFLGYSLEGEPFSDAVQGVRGCFLTGAGPRIELLESLPGSSTLQPWVDAGIKLYHLAYLVSDIMASIAWAQSTRGRVVSPPVPAVAFEGRRVCFFMFRTGQLVEFIESTHRSDSCVVKQEAAS